MFPLLPIGPFRLSSGGLLLLLGVIVASSALGRIARRQGGDGLSAQAERCFYPVMLGAIIGARLYYGLFNLDMYGRQPSLFWALRVSDLAWPGALLGGTVMAIVWCRLRQFELLALADSVALALPIGESIASFGLLLSGEAFGTPTSLPWAISLFGAWRHPVQVYYALLELLNFAILWRLARQDLPAGTLMAGYCILEGLTMLLVEVLRADALLLPGGLRAAQVFGLGLLLFGIAWLRRTLTAMPYVASNGSRKQAPPSAA